MEFQSIMQEKLEDTGIIPVVKLNKPDNAADLAKALLAGGIKAVEITFRAKGAEQVIESIVRNFPDMIVGAGTVLTVEQAKEALKAGAQFLVSPGFDEELVDYCIDNKIPVFPGCVTPTEIQKAIRKGLNVIKFFPASQYGGLEAMKALSGPFPGIRFMPTGGISEKNLEEYLSSSLIFACGGSFMVKEAFLDNGRWELITEKTAEAVKIKERVRG